MRKFIGGIGLSLALLTTTIAAVFSFQAMAAPADDWKVEAGEPVITQDSGAYTVDFTGTALKMAQKAEMSAKTDVVSIKFTTQNAWLCVGLRTADSSKIAAGAYLYLSTETDGSKALRVAPIADGAANYNANKNRIFNFDMTREHTISFVEVKNGESSSWFLKIDDLLCDESVKDCSPEGVTEAPAQGYDMTAGLTAAGFKGNFYMEVENGLKATLKIGPPAPVVPESTDWLKAQGAPSITGTMADGYTIAFKAPAGATGADAGMLVRNKTEMDAREYAVKMKFSTDNAWVSYAFCDEDGAALAGFYLYIHDAASGTGKDLRIAPMNNPNAGKNIIRNFDFTKEHTLSFVEVKDGDVSSWFLKIDDLLCDESVKPGSNEGVTAAPQGYDMGEALEAWDFTGYYAIGSEVSLDATVKFEKNVVPPSTTTTTEAGTVTTTEAAVTTAAPTNSNPGTGVPAPLLGLLIMAAAGTIVLVSRQKRV